MKNTVIVPKTRLSKLDTPNTRAVVLLTRESSSSKPPQIRLIRTSRHQQLRTNHTRARQHALAGKPPSHEQTHMVDLVVGHKLNRSIGKDPDQSRRMALEESPTSPLLINLCTSAKRSAPTPGVLLEVRVRGLKKDLDPVQRRNYCLSLEEEEEVSVSETHRGNRKDARRSQLHPPQFRNGRCSQDSACLEEE